MDVQNESQIANFYANRSVFITGATGFMGKVSCATFDQLLINLRTCAQVLMTNSPRYCANDAGSA